MAEKTVTTIRTVTNATCDGTPTFNVSVPAVANDHPTLFLITPYIR